jgi:hypothetical protein
MGFFGSLLKIFNKKEENELKKNNVCLDDLIGVKYSDVSIKNNHIVNFEKIEKKEEKKDFNVKTLYNNQQGVIPMAERYLVVLDTTNRPEVKDRGLQGGLKNFYFVFATTADQAREIVLRSFARSPAILNQIQYSLTVTPISKIIPLMNEKNFFWSYIPFNASQRSPGQRSTPPPQKTNPNNPEEVIPMDPREIPIPVTPENQNDTPKVNEIPEEAKKLGQSQINPMMAFMSPTFPNGQPNPMFAMMQMMAAAAGMQPPSPVEASPPKSTVTRGDPNNDPELASRMAEVRSTAVARHRNHDPSALDENMERAEREANEQVERFKSLPKEQQVKHNLNQVDMNDIGVDINHMKQIMESSNINKE